MRRSSTHFARAAPDGRKQGFIMVFPKPPTRYAAPLALYLIDIDKRRCIPSNVCKLLMWEWRPQGAWLLMSLGQNSWWVLWWSAAELERIRKEGGDISFMTTASFRAGYWCTYYMQRCVIGCVGSVGAPEMWMISC